MMNNEIQFDDFTMFYPTDEILNSVPKDFQIHKFIEKIQEQYCIAYLKTEAQTNTKNSFLIAINDKEFLGFVAMNNQDGFDYYPIKSESLNKFVALAQIRTAKASFYFNQSELVAMTKKIKEEFNVFQEKDRLEKMVLPLNKENKIKI